MILGVRADWKALTFCVLAACTFWLLNALNQDYTDTISYPFRVEYDETKLVPIEEIPDKIRINVTAYGWVMLRKSLGINAEPIVYTIERLPKKNYISSGQLTPLVSRQLKDLRLNFLVTDTVYLKFERLRSKKIKVALDIASIPLAPSYHLVTPVTISPDSITVKGPASLVKELPDSIVLNVSGENLKGELEETIKIPESRFDVKLELMNKEVRVRFTAARFEKESVVLNVQPFRFPADTNLFSFERKVILTYFVKEEDKGKVKPGEFKAILDFRKMDKRDSTIIPKLTRKPEFIKDHYFTPYAVRVRKRQ